MKYELTATEARVTDYLLEKQVTMPEQYSLSINGVAAARSQKTNCEPAVDLPELDVQEQLDSLVERHFLRTVSGFGNHVTKYKQRFCDSKFSNLRLSVAEMAIITTLPLRDAQTSGELRSRTSHMHEFSNMVEVESTLEDLATREDGPYIIHLACEPGKRGGRCMHPFCGEVGEAITAADGLLAASGDLHTRVEALEAEVIEPKQRLDSLLAHLGG